MAKFRKKSAYCYSIRDMNYREMCSDALYGIQDIYIFHQQYV